MDVYLSFKRLSNKMFCVSLPFFLLILSNNLYSWHAAGHMLVASVAYKNLDSTTQKKMDALLTVGADQYPKSNTFITASVWADDIKSYGVNFFNDWHYQDIYFSTDGTPIPNVFNKGRAFYVLNKNLDLLSSTETNDIEKSFALRFVTHIYGDMHQPMHSVSRVSKEFPRGDLGGNRFKLKGQYKHLHALWDSGLATLPELKRPLDAKSVLWLDKYTQELMTEYPVSSFTKEQVVADFKVWEQENSLIVKNSVYHDIQENAHPTSDYINNNKKIIRRQLALAGYRLANKLNCLSGTYNCVK